MKKFAQLAVAVALLATPLFAAKKTTVTIPNDVTVGSTQIPAGDYKLTYDGAGPAVKVTLLQPGRPPIALDAKLVQSRNFSQSVTLGKKPTGERVLMEIDLGRTTLIFDTPQVTEQAQSADQ